MNKEAIGSFLLDDAELAMAAENLASEIAMDARDEHLRQYVIQQTRFHISEMFELNEASHKKGRKHLAKFVDRLGGEVNDALNE